jgi:anaerobic magnesium-protoporphyrin IX monomethyl ester cyclase
MLPVVLFNPPNAARPKPLLPLSLLSLGAVIGDVADWRIVDGNLESDPLAAIERAITDMSARVLGMTVMPGPQLGQAIALSRTLKARHPDLLIVWGGYFPTQHWDVALRSPYVDAVVRGHGEFVFRDLLCRIGAGEPFEDLPGVASRDPSSGEPRSNALAPIPNPNTLPDFPYDRVDLRRYVRRTVLGTRTLSHHSSYGCPFMCNFCAVVNMVGGAWKAQSAERTAHVVERLVALADINALELFDNNFFVHRARTREFAERITPLHLTWWGEGRIDTLLRYKPDDWQAMARSGLKMIFMGAESGSDETLRRMDKGGTMSAESTLAIADVMGTHGIVPEFSFVLGSPPDPEGDVANTIEFIKRLKRVNRKSEIIMYMYTPVPLAGELYDQAKASGFAFPTTLEGWCDPAWVEFSQRRSTTMPWVQDRLRQQVRDFERVLNAYYPTSTNPSLLGARSWLLRGVSAWRWHANVYRHPVELRALHRLVAYQRPETTGF